MRLTFRTFLSAAVLAGVLTAAQRPAQAYIEAAFTLGKIVNDSTTIVLMQVESVDTTKNTITFKKIEDIKGKHPQEIVKQNIARAGFAPREWQNIMNWAQVGQQALFFHNGSASETCINNYWYQCYPGGEWWNMYHGEPYLLRSFAGKPERLAPLLKEMLQGKEVIVTAMVDGNKDALHNRNARIQRLKASTKLVEYNAQRDFVGWGGDDLRPIASMPGFTHYSSFSRTSPGAGGTLTFDFDMDGKRDFLLYGEARVGLYLSDGSSTNEVPLPITGGARGAAVGSLRHGKALDLILATPTGPKLITNLGSGQVRDDSAALPAPKYTNSTSVAVLDYDVDGRPDVLVADGFAGLRLYRNITPKDAAKDAAPKFEEVTDKVGLGALGVAAPGKVRTLLVADVDGDSRPDVVAMVEGSRRVGDAISTGSAKTVDADQQIPLVLLNTASGFAFGGSAIIPISNAGATPALVTLDGAVHLVLPHSNADNKTSNVSFYRFDAKGGYTGTGMVPSFPGQATSVVCETDKSGQIILTVGVLRAPNRVFTSKDGGTTFADESDALGLTKKIYNTRAVSVLDLNKDGTPDLLLNNEGQEPVLLIGNPNRKEGALR